MGMYDTFYGTCPHCGGEFHSQTKLTPNCALDDYTVGDVIEMHDQKLTMKDPCEHCEKYVTVIIEHGRVIAFTADKNAFKEGMWGSIEKMPP